MSAGSGGMNDGEKSMPMHVLNAIISFQETTDLMHCLTYSNYQMPNSDWLKLNH